MIMRFIMPVRKYYLDNVRLMIILVLFPYHTLLLYSGVGSYYFHVTNDFAANAFILSFAPWFMQLLFVIAGIAAHYSLKRRNPREYLTERVSKLLIPMIAGAVLVMPLSIYFGYLYNGYGGSFPALWWELMSNGVRHLESGLLIGPLWFLFYLFAVSILAFPVIVKYKPGESRSPVEKVTIPKLLLLVIPLAIGSYFLNFYPEKSLVQFLLLFLFGYFLLSDDGVQRKLEERRWPLFITFLVLTIIYVKPTATNITNAAAAAAGTTPMASYFDLTAFLVKLFTDLILWLGVLSVMGMGKHFLEFRKRSTLYLSAVSFPIYIFHIVWINLFAYCLLKWMPDRMISQILLTMLLSFLSTIATIEVLKRIKITRVLFGMKGL